MPSPIAHLSSGYAIAQLFPLNKKNCQRRNEIIQILFVLFVAVAPDLDFIPQLLTGVKLHHGLTHSLVFTIGFTVVVWGLGYFLQGRLSKRLFLLTLMLYGSHLLLDFFTEGGPGIQLFWPFTDAYYRSPVTIFPETFHSEALFQHPGHFIFIAFEWGYTAVLLSGVWFWKYKKKRSDGSVSREKLSPDPVREPLFDGD